MSYERWVNRISTTLANLLVATINFGIAWGISKQFEISFADAVGITTLLWVSFHLPYLPRKQP